MFRLNNLDSFDVPPPEKKRIQIKISKVVRKIDLQCKSLLGKAKLKKINQILQQDHFFDSEKYPKKKRNRNGVSTIILYNKTDT